MPLSLASGLPQTFAGIAGAAALIVGTPLIVSADTHATLGAPGVEVPAVVGMPEADAAATLAELGFAFEAARDFQDDVDAGLVYWSEPLAGMWMDAGSTVQLGVSDGPRMVVVPDFALISLADAPAAGDAQDGPNVVVREKYSDDVPEGALISQDVPAGASVRHDSFVNVLYSSGLEPVVIPDVTGRNKSNASDVLKSKGLKVKVKEQSSDSVDKGDVIKQSPKGGADGHRKDTVTIWVSTGKKSVSRIALAEQAMIAMRGMTESQARSYAKAHGITLEVYYSATYPTGSYHKVFLSTCNAYTPIWCEVVLGGP